jgi:hypothetical protein
LEATEAQPKYKYPVLWYPDTCECIINMDEYATQFEFVKRCELHLNASIDDLIKHNQSFNLKVYDAVNKENDNRLRGLAKAAEKARSRVAQATA